MSSKACIPFNTNSSTNEEKQYPEGQTTGNLISGLFNAYIDRKAYVLLSNTSHLLKTLSHQATVQGIFATITNAHEREEFIHHLGHAKGAKITLVPDLPCDAKPHPSIAIISKTCTKKQLHKAAKLIARGKFFATGTSPGSVSSVYVHEEIQNEFVELLLECTREMFGSNAQRSKDFGRFVDPHAHQHGVKGLEKLLDGNLKGETKVILGANFDEKDHFISPTLIDNVPGNSTLGGGIMGPILPIVPLTSTEEVFAFLENKFVFSF